MKKHYSVSLLTLIFAMLSIAILPTGCTQKVNPSNAEENDHYDGADAAAQFEWERTHDLTTGKIPMDKLLAAMQYTEALKANNGNLTGNTSALTWAERGPNGDFSTTGNPRGFNDQTAGRVRAVMVDSTDPTHKTVWLGGVDGGLWKTTDITVNPSPWVLQNDFMSNLAIAAICQDPRPGFQNIMYVATGESFRNADAVRGVGVFKSTDGGATWNFLPSTSNYINCTRILCDYLGNVYLGTRNTGLLRSTNGGTSWTDITPSGAGTASIADLEISSTSAAGRLHVTTGIGSTCIYRYTDIPTTVTAGTWTSPTTGFTTYAERCEIAVSGNVLYAAPCNPATYNVPTIYKSTDGGDNWAAIASQPNGGNWPNGQGWYNLTVRINPADPNQVIVGGLDNWKTTNSGASWTHLSFWATAGQQYVHADNHNCMWYDGGNQLIFTSDGGCFYSSDGGTTIRDRNKGLRIKQFYSVAIHPTFTNCFLAGAQDNGMHILNHPGLDSSREVVGGDGMFAAIDQSNGNNMFGTYVYNNYRRSTNGGASWSSPVGDNNGRFVNPWDFDQNTKNIYACYTANNYFRWTNAVAGNTTAVVPMAAFAGGNVSAVYCSPFTANRVFFGTGSGGVIRVDNADGAAPSGTMLNTGLPAAYVNCVVAGSVENTMIATFTTYGVGHVWLTTNGGTTWTDISGNLPDMPVRWALFHPDTDTKAYIATETGVWETDLINGASTVWSPNSTFPNCRVDMIKYRASDRLIAAGTHGRGIFTANIPSGCTAASITSQPSNASTCVGNTTSFSVTSGGTTPITYQWQVSTTGCGGAFSNVTNGGVYSGATTSTLTITGATAGMNNYAYKVIVTGNCAPLTVTSNCAVLTVNSATNITSQPSNSTLCAGNNTTFNVAATGTSLSYQWQVSTDGGTTWTNVSNGGVYSGATTSSLTITGATIAMNGYQYRAVVNSACSPLNSNAATLTVNAPPSISNQPSNNSVCAGNAASFSVTATGGSLTYQWYESTDGGTTYNPLANGGAYSGVTSSTLTINPTTTGMNNYRYRVVINGVCGAPATSTGAILNVGTAMSVTGQPSSSTVCSGATVNFSVTATGTVNGYQWQESTNGGASWNNITNGGVYSGATTNTLTLTGVTGTMNGYQYRAVVSGNCPSINSNAATLTVNTPPSISSQPSASTICNAQNTSFSVTASGTNITYQWQVSTTGCGGTFTNITNGGVYSGATTNTLTITNAPTTMNGYAYRVVINGTCAPAATSSCVLLTVNTPVAVTSQPGASTACAGATATFTVAASGTSPTYQWQESTNGGATWSNIVNGGIYSGATSTTLTLTGITAGMNGYLYRAVVTGASPCGTANSNSAALTVNTAPAITAQPVASRTICGGQNTSYSVTATGTALTYQWQVSTDGGTTWTNVANGGVYSGATSSTLTITGGTVSMNNYQYRAIVSGTCSPSATTSASSLTVYTPISITTQPTATTICSTGTMSFSIVAAGTSPTYQWQVSTDGGTTWTNVTDNTTYSGSTTATLTITGVTTGMNNYQYRNVVTGLAPCGAVNSNPATLTVTARPTITLSASPYTRLLPGYTTTLTATSSITPASNAAYIWYYNNVVIPNVTGTSYIVDVNKLGDYKVTVTDISNSCFNTSNIVNISDSASSKLFIWPSPTFDGQFSVAYYNQGGNSTAQDITIYNSLGARVYAYKDFPVNQAYQILKVDMRRNGAGVYVVVLRLKDGTKKTGTVVIR